MKVLNIDDFKELVKSGNIPTTTTCIIINCDKKRKSRNGLCSTHYQRQVEGRDMFSAIRSFFSGTNEEKFLKDVKKTETCWLWMGNKRHGGYGAFTPRSFNKKERYPCGLAHRWAYENWVGSIPKSLVVDHICRVRHCVKPSHLRVVTQRENILCGTGASARSARKTHCSKGHEYSVENTIVNCARGWRRCKECTKQSNKIRWQKIKNLKRFEITEVKV